ncbi:MAG: pyruvate ferredoxin oxidoreductase [Deltaproteobacteria bacterium]|nr:MAG: pyruvate ferredoxin oxidoreductase [Deltaproteobacteria bacterium]
MRQQIVISGLGGQGVLFLTRVIAESALRRGAAVLTAETHGMAQRGGSVLSTVKIGTFRSPLIARGTADLGLFLAAENLPVHGPLLREGAALVVAAAEPGAYRAVDAAAVARELGAPVLANLVVLGAAVADDLLCVGRDEVEETIRVLSPPKLVEGNLTAFRRGLALAGSR